MARGITNQGMAAWLLWFATKLPNGFLNTLRSKKIVSVLKQVGFMSIVSS